MSAFKRELRMVADKRAELDKFQQGLETILAQGQFENPDEIRETHGALLDLWDERLTNKIAIGAQVLLMKERLSKTKNFTIELLRDITPFTSSFLNECLIHKKCEDNQEEAQKMLSPSAISIFVYIFILWGAQNHIIQHMLQFYV